MIRRNAFSILEVLLVSVLIAVLRPLVLRGSCVEREDI